jgi:hypothetical protein
MTETSSPAPARRICAGWDETAAHEHQRGSLVGDSPKQTRRRKAATNRRERREGRVDVRDYGR